MTFDEAFDAAAREAINETTEGRSWWGYALGKPKSPWRPTAERRWKAVESCREACREQYEMYDELPSRRELRRTAAEALGGRCAFGPLTWVWLAVMVLQLLNLLKELLYERKET